MLTIGKNELTYDTIHSYFHNYLFVEPNHRRALDNKVYYEELLEKKQVDKRSTNTIKNQRPKDYLEERELYEQLCRHNGSKVKFQ